MRALMLAFLWCAAAMAQGTETKKAAAEYPAHGRVGDLEIGAEYMVHSVSFAHSTFITEDYLVVEVAIFPPDRRDFVVKTSDFTLRLNGKQVMMTQTPGIVASSLRYNDWGQDPQSRFPGDNRGNRQPFPPVPRAPEDSGAPDTATPDASEVINRSALPEGPRKTSVSGYLFFPWRGKLSKIKSLELLVQAGSEGPVAIRLR